MLQNIYIGLRDKIKDVQGQGLARRIQNELNLNIQQLEIVKIYILEGIDREQAQTIIDHDLLSDPVLHKASLYPISKDSDWIIEIGFRPGVTDNEGRVAKETIRNGLSLSKEKSPNVYTAVQYFLQGELDFHQVKRISTELLANELIEQYQIKSQSEWYDKPELSLAVPRVTGHSSDQVEIIPISEMKDQELLNLSQERILALSLDEMQWIKSYYSKDYIQKQRREENLTEEPTDVELEVLAQTWSEHCKHKIFNSKIDYLDKRSNKRYQIDSLFKTYIQDTTQKIRSQRGDQDYCLSVFKDNAGVIRFDAAHNLCFKVETHNSPSALDPYGGALTGIVGVNRDPMGTGLGSNLIANTDVFCFASPFYQQELPPRLLHPHRVLEGVRKGVEHGGNQSGIPTVNGGLVFDERYLGKPLVFCGTLGILPATIQGRPSQDKKARVEDIIVMVGGRVGKDGIHGATFSSEALHEGSPATAVQIGDPITQRKMYDFLMIVRDLGLYNAITDNGAGGLSSSVGEMAEDTGGCLLDLAKVPLKYDGLLPWEILLSEAQERMTVAVPEEKLSQFLQLAKEMDVEATTLGQFTDSGFFKVFYGQKILACLDLQFMHHGLPQMQLEAVWEPKPTNKLKIPSEVKENKTDLLRKMLSRLNICSREYVIRQYDHEVQGTSVIKPMVGQKLDGPGDAAVIRPVLNSQRGLVISNGICPRFSDLDTYWMMAWAIDEAIRNALAVGGNPGYMAGVDNFCWCDPVQSEKTPDGRSKLAQLVRANQALSHFCLGFNIPCISGKDSMKNDYFMGGIKISIPPTVLFSLISVVPDVQKCLTSDFKKPGQLIYILGQTRKELGASELAAELGSSRGQVPQVDLLSARERYYSLYQAIQEGILTACHDISDGGLAVAAAEMAIGGELGASLDLAKVPKTPTDLTIEETMYSESASRFLVCLDKKDKSQFESIFSGQDLALVGQVLNEPEIEFTYSDQLVFKDQVQDLKKAWKQTMDW